MEMFKYDEKKVHINMNDSVMILRNPNKSFTRLFGGVIMEQVQNFVESKLQTSIYSSHAEPKGN